MNKFQARYVKAMARKAIVHANTLVSEMKAIEENYQLEDITVVSIIATFEGMLQDCTDIESILSETLAGIDNQEKELGA